MQTSPSQPEKPGRKKTLLAVIVIGIIAAGIVVFVATALFIGPSLSVTTKPVAPYQSPVSQNPSSPSSVTVADVNGGITFSQWSRSDLLINGTITARGISANPDTITFVSTNSSGNIVFQAIFAQGTFFFSTGYTVDINVFTPTSYHFSTVQATTVNGEVKVNTINTSSMTLTVTNGKITANAIYATSLTLTDTNGSIDFTCTSCGTVTATATNGSITASLTTLSLTGSYTLTATNGSINLTLPTTASFKITANATNGSVSSTGLSRTLQNHVTLGTGTAIVTATTTNGSITVTGV